MLITNERITRSSNFVRFSERLSDGDLRHIIDLSEDLIETYCAVPNSYCPFDPHVDCEHESKREIQRLARELFLWAAHISQCRLGGEDVSQLIDYYLPVIPADRHIYESAIESLRHDLTETVGFLATQLLLVCANGNQLVIKSI